MGSQSIHTQPSWRTGRRPEGNDMTKTQTAREAILKYGLKCRCPRCGKGRLFNGFLTLAPHCDSCGLDYSFADPADGPAFFVMMAMSVPVTALAVWIELTYEPPFWVHF